ncbi:MAG: Fur family transcriptional regulator [Alphaproteobacteria bacterium]|nr:Fur family transcriptional regulator [Alphaproteobacteria bacterium]MBM3625974.1 Fur family transcriptional regulator [Alphaproteobacteria bacterium]
MSSRTTKNPARPKVAGLTPARRRALDILTEANRPVGAYEMIDLMADDDGKRPAPVSVYRALGYLMDNGLAHRLASKNAYIVCGHAHEAEEPVVFIICEQCGEVKEATSPGFARELAALIATANFSARTRVVEIAGRCARCEGK